MELEIKMMNNNYFKVSFIKNEPGWFVDGVEQAAKDMNKIFFSITFKSFFQIEYDKSNFLEGELSSIRHLPPDKILSMIFNCERNLIIRSYWAPFGAIGKTYSNDPTIWINTAKIGSTKNIGSLLSHEVLHLPPVNASHDWHPTIRRPNSLCYLINRVYEKSFDEIMGEEIFTKKKPWWRRIFG